MTLALEGAGAFSAGNKACLLLGYTACQRYSRACFGVFTITLHCWPVSIHAFDIWRSSDPDWVLDFASVHPVVSQVYLAAISLRPYSLKVLRRVRLVRDEALHTFLCYSKAFCRGLRHEV